PHRKGPVRQGRRRSLHDGARVRPGGRGRDSCRAGEGHDRHRDRGNRRLRAGHRGGSGSDRLGPEGGCEGRGEPPGAGLRDLVVALAGARLLVALAPGRLRAPLALLAAGCSTVFGFDDPKSLVDSLDVPSCSTGWKFRMPVTVDNETGKELEDYQIPIVV